MKKDKFNPKMTRRQVLKAGMIAGAGLMVPWNSIIARRAFGQVGQAAPLPGNQIPQFVDPLPLLDITGAGQQNGTMEVWVNDGSLNTIYMREFDAHILPTGLFAPLQKPATRVWGYRLGAAPTLADTYLGPVVVAERAFPVLGTPASYKPTKIKWVNALPNTGATTPTAWLESTDLSLHWANPNGDPMLNPNPPPIGNPAHYSGPIPVVPHLHGGEVPPQLDGGPDAWFTNVAAKRGHAYYSFTGAGANEAIYNYPNTQEAAPIWFHDHALGITRLNVYAGIAGGYIIWDDAYKPPGDLAGVEGVTKIIPLIIQDRMFDINGQLFFPNIGINLEHVYWVPEFVGDVICVNGKSWPYLDVDRKRYRFLFLDGSNARFYDMFLIDPVSGVKGPPMYVIGTDGGYLNNPVLIDPNATGQQAKQGIAKSLVIGPGERYDVLIDFGNTAWLNAISAAYEALGTAVPDPLRLHLRNNARTPFPGGAPAQNSTTGRVMEFRVSTTAGVTLPDITYNPTPTSNLRSGHAIISITGATPAVKRQLTLNEAMGPGGPLEVLVNNTKWGGHSIHEAISHNGVTIDANGVRSDFPFFSGGAYYSELPQEGDTELWEIINITADAHPIHLHLVQFQLVNRQQFDVAGYNAAYDARFPATNNTPDPMTGLPYPGGVFIGGYGPPNDYNSANADGAVGGNPAIGAFLNAKKWPAKLPLQQEKGWKDTMIMYPGEVTRIMVRWAPTDLATNKPASQLHFPFDPNGGHGFVWHCHIIDHEDNEMMRPDAVMLNPLAPSPSARPLKKGTDY